MKPGMSLQMRVLKACEWHDIETLEQMKKLSDAEWRRCVHVGPQTLREIKASIAIGFIPQRPATWNGAGWRALAYGENRK